jgi:hypothetical protein
MVLEEAVRGVADYLKGFKARRFDALEAGGTFADTAHGRGGVGIQVHGFGEAL